MAQAVKSKYILGDGYDWDNWYKNIESPKEPEIYEIEDDADPQIVMTRFEMNNIKWGKF
ncbi:uncharacterized protein PADG_02738 [Paracoccidioides brasiliensis Pb18]|uniref:Uncharacterized protein n=1 Tax=Paracoccidioides brasiliensis (strain Pb18) TaxID=502780 RepID=C1G6D3_PARBD|nr:uncharacterized protein PADG_02738 [Paracoccidioides brasiliensis Pb18]EEH46640.1 hypothetical protein PADG_02738 [Paracoccidioides brasiliensis Pb18]